MKPVYSSSPQIRRIYDRVGRYPKFIEHFHKLLVRSQNALRGRWENLWSSEQTCVVKLVDREAVIDKLVYTATNPVADHLVDRVHHWPGVNGLGALLVGRALSATRPVHFFRPDGPMPDALELPFTDPAELGPAIAVRSELRERIRAVELEHTAERARIGRRVLGRRAVLAQSCRDTPASMEPRWNLRPHVATRSTWARIEALGSGARAGAIAYFMFNVEVQRDRRNMIFSAMSHEAMQQGTDPQSVLSRGHGNGLHPATPKAASVGFTDDGHAWAQSAPESRTAS